MWKPNAAACVPIASKWTGIFPVKFQLVSHNPVSFPQSTMDTSKSFAKCFVLCFFFLECGDVCFKFNFWVKKLSVYPKHLNVQNISLIKLPQLNHFYSEDSLHLRPGRPWETRHIWITDQSLLDGETLWMLTVYSKVNLSCGSIEGPLSDSVNNLVNSFQVDMCIVHAMYLINRKLVEPTVDTVHLYCNFWKIIFHIIVGIVFMQC